GVDAVTEAGDFFLALQHSAYVRDGIFLRLVDRVEDAHDGFVGSAVQWPLQGADGAGDGGVHVRKRSGDDTRGEGAGVELMVGVEDEGDVERASGGCRGLFSVQ